MGSTILPMPGQGSMAPISTIADTPLEFGLDYSTLQKEGIWVTPWELLLFLL